MAAPRPETAASRGADEPPPFWARWSRVYGLVFALLVVETIAFWLLSRWAS